MVNLILISMTVLGTSKYFFFYGFFFLGQCRFPPPFHLSAEDGVPRFCSVGFPVHKGTAFGCSVPHRDRCFLPAVTMESTQVSAA